MPRNENWKVYTVNVNGIEHEHLLDANVLLANAGELDKTKWDSIDLFKGTKIRFPKKDGTFSDGYITRARHASEDEINRFYYLSEETHDDGTKEPVFLNISFPNKSDFKKLGELKSLSDYSYGFLKNSVYIKYKTPHSSDAEIYIDNKHDKDRFLEAYKNAAKNSKSPEIFLNKLTLNFIKPYIENQIKTLNEKYNPDNLKFDYIIHDYGNKNIVVQDKEYFYVEDYKNVTNKNALKAIEAKYPGKTLAYLKEGTDKLSIYDTFPGIKFDITPEAAKNEFLEHLKDYIGDSLINGSSVLCQKNDKIDYSYDAEKGIIPTGMQQLYFQQIRKDRFFKSPYFISSENKLPIKPGEKGIILGNYDSKDRTLNYKFYYNLDQLYNINYRHEIKLPELSGIAFNDSDSKTPKNYDEHLYEKKLKEYFRSIFTGSLYEPQVEIKEFHENLGKAVKNNEFSLLKSTQNAYNAIATNEDSKENNIFLTETEQRQKTRISKKVRGR